MKTIHRALGALVGLGLAAALLAGAQARMKGRATDSAGNPLDDVTITVTTKAISTFKVILKTDKRGIYATIVGDATLTYHLKFEKEGYAPFEGDVKVDVGSTDKGLDAKMTKLSELQAAAEAAAPPSPDRLAAGAYNEGVDLLNSGKSEAAEKKFLEALKNSPDLPSAWRALAIIAFDKKDWAKTLEYGQKATDLDPSLTGLYGMMVQAAKNVGDKRAAAEWEAKFAEANPDTPEILYNKGVEAYNKNKMKEAEETLTRAIAARPDYALAHFWLAMAQINLKKNAPAKQNFQKYLEIDPKGSEADTAKEMLSVLK